MTSNRITIVMGTRPEAIKLAPLITQLRTDHRFVTRVIVTGQHRTMLDQVLKFFDITPDIDLNIMTANQTLPQLTADLLTKISPFLTTTDTDWVIVQGDTTTAFVAALAARYGGCKVGHIEAGLRSFDKLAPFPEELNRCMISQLTDIHFAPTQSAADHLARESISTSVYVVGNTVIDALLMGIDKLDSDPIDLGFMPPISSDKPPILVTGHRRENFGAPFEAICHAMRDIVTQAPDCEIIYPVHLNPNVQDPVFRILNNHPRIHLIPPVNYPEMIYLLRTCALVLTDSGGIQEEAPALGKPVVVMRDVTERMEGVTAGTAVLVGSDRTKIVSTVLQLWIDPTAHARMATAINPYGDGTAVSQIIAILAGKLL